MTEIKQAKKENAKKAKFKNFPFFGINTALATPFLKEDENKIDFSALEKILKDQTAAGVNGIVLFGSTGEHFSLTENEKKDLFFTVKEICGPALPLICCAGNPSTKQTLRDALLYKSYGATGLLLLTPFYYKCADNGAIAHFSVITETVKLPALIYNVPSRTGYDLYKKPNVLNALGFLDYVAGIKEAESDELIITDFIKHSPLPVLSGSDENNLAAYRAGAAGAISVASNVFPKETVEIYDSFFNKDDSVASKKDNFLKPVYKMLTLEGNPVPLKYALKKIYGCGDKPRLPLTPLSEKNKKLADKIFKNFLK